MCIYMYRHTHIDIYIYMYTYESTHWVLIMAHVVAVVSRRAGGSSTTQVTPKSLLRPTNPSLLWSQEGVEAVMFGKLQKLPKPTRRGY